MIAFTRAASLLVAAAALLLPTSATHAQDRPAPPPETATPAPTLKAGMPAPEFRVESFLKGKPFTAFEKGRIYIVEFWATWCGPCVLSMPHLSELQREYADKGVTICGVNVWQEKEYSPATLDTVTKFVQTKGDGMDYSVACDGAAAAMATVLHSLASWASR